MNVREVTDRLFPNWTMGGSMRTPEVQEVYLQHGLGGAMDPTRRKSARIVQLAVNLQEFKGTGAPQKLAS